MRETNNSNTEAKKYNEQFKKQLDIYIYKIS